MLFDLFTLPEGASLEIKRSGGSIDYDGIKEWLCIHNILPCDSIIHSYHDILAWQVGGGETYLCSFEIAYEHRALLNKKHIVIKAIISPQPGERLKEWQRRRSILESNSIPVSNWYWSGEGNIIEDFYPHDHTCVNDKRLLFDMAKILDKLGFKTLNYLNDIRCDIHGNPFYVDFGFDLGEPSSDSCECAIRQYRKAFENQLNNC